MAWSLWTFTVALFAAAALLYYRTPVVSRLFAEEEWFAGTAVLVGALWLAYPTVGALIVLRRPRNPIGWIFCLGGLVVVATFCARTYTDYSLFARAAPLPATTYVAWFFQSGIALSTILLTTALLLLLFPDGSPPSRGWWAVAWMAVAGSVLIALLSGTWPGPMYEYPSIENPFGIEGAVRAFIMELGHIGFLLMFLGGIFAGISLFPRWHRAGQEERRQLKWFAYSAGLVLFASWIWLWSAGAYIAPALLPVAVGFAIFKHRLYDIDLVINRTLVYGALTVSLALVYFGSVVGLQRLLSPVVGEGNQLAVVASTLAIAALFVPLRRRVQAFVDRRFYRQKYDAARVLAAFSATLRDETNLDSLSTEMVSVVRETMQPEHVSLWLRGPEGEARR